jgi:hypothetical protein
MVAKRQRNRPNRQVKRSTKPLKPLKGAPHLRVSVSEAEIDGAIKGDAFRCMIVRAIQVAYPKYIHVTVDLQTIRFSDPARGVRYVYLTPRIAQAALVLFDQGKKVRPFKFHLRGAHTISMQRINPQKGVVVSERLKLGRQKERLKFGRQRVLSDSATANGIINIIGGRAAPRHQPSHSGSGKPSASGGRRFGMRAFTNEDLAEVSACSPAFEAEKRMRG